MKKLLALALLPAFAQAQISFNEISLKYVKGDRDPVNEAQPQQQNVEGTTLEAKYSIHDIAYVAAGYETIKTDYSFQAYDAYRSKLESQIASIGLGIHTPITREIADTVLFAEARANFVSYEEENSESTEKIDEYEKGQTLRLGLAFSPAKVFEFRPSLARMSDAGNLTTTIYELGFRVHPVENLAFIADFEGRVDLDQHTYNVGLLYQF